MAAQLEENHTSAKLIVSYSLHGNLSSSRGVTTVDVPISKTHALAIASMMENISFVGSQSVIIESALQTNMSLDAGGLVTTLGPFTALNLTVFSGSSSDFPQWHFASQCGLVSASDSPLAVPGDGGGGPPGRGPPGPAIPATFSSVRRNVPSRTGGWWSGQFSGPAFSDASVDRTEQRPPNQPQVYCPLALKVASEKVVPSVTGGSSTSNMSLTVVYISFVYAFGKFLRLAFQDSSKRMPYEELEDTKLLMDLCDGIYISRKAGQLRREDKLYYELIHIYRSPELLYDVSRRTRGSRGAGHSQSPSRHASTLQDPDLSPTDGGLRRRGSATAPASLSSPSGAGRAER
mmetsp:Transcript_94413/g.303574  ORF Transcript_94413/g.303574 Transcript_94413/m.303574 type:complete len:347 (+) Transcript_94413:1420-2460(+)